MRTAGSLVGERKTESAVVTTLGAGSVEYGAIRRPPAGALIPHGDLYAVVGWDGQPITHVDNVRDGLDAVRSYYATTAIGTAEPAASLRY